MSTTQTRSAERIEFLTDVLTIAVDGGIGYWSQCSDYCYSSDDPAERGVTLYVADVDADDFIVPTEDDTVGSWGGGALPARRVRVTLDTIAHGVSVVTSGKTTVHDSYVEWIYAASMKNDAGTLDADDADIIVQAGIFGGVLFG